ncbi:hypothetical protein DFH11DRAFT_1115750 [Phellopilus nigrolimitatus]|nr:hypothetical protein DFH11DRAFT_1115750 [Phellopilus nigrolimitatus]
MFVICIRERAIRGNKLHPFSSPFFSSTLLLFTLLLTPSLDAQKQLPKQAAPLSFDVMSWFHVHNILNSLHHFRSRRFTMTSRGASNSGATLFLGSPVSQISRLDGSAVESKSFDDLVVAGNEVDRLIIPFDIIAVDVEHDAFYRLLAREFKCLTVIHWHDLQTRLFDGREVHVFERLRPKTLL